MTHRRPRTLALILLCAALLFGQAAGWAHMLEHLPGAGQSHGIEPNAGVDAACALCIASGAGGSAIATAQNARRAVTVTETWAPPSTAPAQALARAHGARAPPLS